MDRDTLLAIIAPFCSLQNKAFDTSNFCKEKLLFSTENLTRQNKLLLSGGIAASVTSSVYNSLDCLRVRWQTLPQTSKFEHFTSRGILYFTRCIVRHEGFVNGLCRPGVLVSAVAGSCSAGLRFGFYEHIRDTLFAPVAGGDKSSTQMLLAGFTCGGVAYFFTTPLQVIKTKIQASQNSTLYTMSGKKKSVSTCCSDVPTSLRAILRKEGFLGLWKGASTVTARGALFSSGQMLGYDGFKTFCKSNEIMEDGVRLHVASSIVAACCSTALSTPADFVLARYVSSSSSLTIIDCIRLIYRENGVVGFWRGSGLAFVRLCPVILSYTMLYEQLRKQFGLGYLS